MRQINSSSNRGRNRIRSSNTQVTILFCAVDVVVVAAFPILFHFQSVKIDLSFRSFTLFLIRLFAWLNSIDICFCFCFTFYSCIRIGVPVSVRVYNLNVLIDWNHGDRPFVCVYKPVVTVSWRSNHKHVHKHTHTNTRTHAHYRYIVYWRSLCLQFLVCCTTYVNRVKSEWASERKREDSTRAKDRIVGVLWLLSLCVWACVFLYFQHISPLSR